MSFMNLPNEPPIELNEDGTSFGLDPLLNPDGSGFGRYPLFTRISIETLSFCNRDCVFCPLHWSQEERGRKRMDDKLYRSIVEELGELGFDGVAQMFLLSEPTIDKTMHDKLRLLRKACPEVTIYASTNGDVFESLYKHHGEDAARDRMLSYFDAGLTVMNVNIYDGADADIYRKLFDRMLGEEVKHTDNKYRRHNPRRRYIELTDMRIESNGTQSMTNVLYIKTKAERATITAPQIHCARTQRHLVVEYDGNVPICCAIDVTDKSLPSMGNINNQSLLEVWNGEPMNRYRWFTQQKRRVLPGCSTCTHRMAFPAIVRKVSPDRATAERWESLRA